MRNLLLTVALAVALAACGGAKTPEAAAPASGKATAADAAKFIDGVNAEYQKNYAEATAASWVKATYITDDTQLLESKQTERGLALLSRQIEESKKFVGVDGIAPDVARQLLLLKIATSLPAPSDPKKLEELTQIASRMDGAYGAGKWCPPGKSECLTLDDLEKVIDDPARTPAERADAWAGWHTVGRGIRKDYVRFSELALDGVRPGTMKARR